MLLRNLDCFYRFNSRMKNGSMTECCRFIYTPTMALFHVSSLDRLT